MNIGSWLLFAVFFWFSGYGLPKILDPGPNSQLVHVPKWIFWLIGAPKLKNVPMTVVYLRSLFLQLMGIIMALYGVLLSQSLEMEPSLSGLLGFAVSMLLGGVVALWLYRRRPFVWSNHFSGNDKNSG